MDGNEQVHTPAAAEVEAFGKKNREFSRQFNDLEDKFLRGLIVGAEADVIASRLTSEQITNDLLPALEQLLKEANKVLHAAQSLDTNEEAKSTKSRSFQAFRDVVFVERHLLNAYRALAKQGAIDATRGKMTEPITFAPRPF